ncbi:MAG: DinB family protein, partial [Sphingobacteriaceae bacterium]|nr:DinB family protein [Cytophagaceae bacterium]
LASPVPVWTGEAVNAGYSIEAIVARTWREKELVPAVAAPRLGGPVAYWAAMLRNLTPTLHTLGNALTEADLARMTPPHPISGPLDVRQRLEFLRFHLDRHCGQVVRLRERLP